MLHKYIGSKFWQVICVKALQSVLLVKFSVSLSLGSWLRFVNRIISADIYTKHHKTLIKDDIAGCANPDEKFKSITTFHFLLTV